jgi:hypothetical protein
MQDMTQITVTMSDDTLGKLSELAGSETRINEYLAHLVLILHPRKCGQAGQVELEQAIIEIDELLKNEMMYKQEIRSLEQRLGRALASEPAYAEAPYGSHLAALRRKH